MLTELDVHAAADRLVAAFEATDTDAYFACFTPEASFIFYAEPERFADRAAYERVWSAWVASGWRVESCRSSERLIQTVGDVAVLSHTVRTETVTGEQRMTTLERETIVFALHDSQILAVHEHLSPLSEST